LGLERSVKTKPKTKPKTNKDMNLPKPRHRALKKPLLFAGAVLMCHSMQATLLFEDGFNYSTGGLNGSDVSPAGTSGNAWSSGSSRITVVSGNLTYSGLADLGGNSVQNIWGLSAGSVINTYTAQTSGNIYYSFLLNCTTAPSASTYLTSLNPGTGAPNGSGDALQVDVAPNAGGFQVGLRTAGASITLAPTVLSLNTTYPVVAEYSFGGSGSATLYLNPVVGASQPTADVTLSGNGTVTSFADLGFKAQNTPVTGTFLIDSVRVGTTWADVTPVAPVPEPSVLALGGLGAVGLAVHLRRRRV
jgi:hypothetical protein